MPSTSDTDTWPDPADSADRTPGGDGWAADGDGRGDGQRLLLAVPTVLMAVLVSIGISARPPWQDELATWWAVTLPPADFWRLLQSWDVVFVLYYLPMRAWVELFGTSELALRLPSSLAMVAATAALTALGRRLWGAAGGVAAGVIFAITPMITRMAHEARPYAFVTAGAVLSTLLLLRAAERPTRGRWTAYGAAVAVTGCLHLISMGLLAAHAAWLWQTRRAGPAPATVVRRWLITLGVASLPVLAMGVLGQTQRGQVSWIDTPWESLLWMPNDLTGANTLAAVLGLLMLFAVSRRWGRLRPTLTLLTAWGFLPIMALYLARPVFDLFVPRYLLFTVAAWCLLAAGGLVRVTDLLQRAPAALHGRRAAAAAMTVVLLALGTLTRNGHTAVRLPETWQPDFAAIAQTVSAQQQAGDGIVYQNDSYRERLSMAYLLGAAGPKDVLLQTPAARNGSYDAVECQEPAACAAPAARIWLVTTRADDPFAHLPSAKADYLRTRYVLSQTHRFQLAQLLLLVSKPPDPTVQPVSGPPGTTGARPRPTPAR